MFVDLKITQKKDMKKGYAWHSEFSAIECNIEIFSQPGRTLNKTQVRDLIAIGGISSYISLVSLGTLSHLLARDQFSNHISLFTYSFLEDVQRPHKMVANYGN